MMTLCSYRFPARWTLLLASLLLFEVTWAQGLRAPANAGSLRPSPTNLPLTLTSAPAAQRQSSDFIVAVVGSEPVTNQEVSVRAQMVLAQMQQQGVRPPQREQLLREVLDQLVQEKAQLQWAQEIGVQVNDAEVDSAEQEAAERSQQSLESWKAELERRGFSVKLWRQEIKNQLILQRLRDREVIPRIRPTDNEIDQYLRERQAQQVQAQNEVNLAQILIEVPENATGDEVARRQAQAQTILERLRSGEDFSQLARAVSASADRNVGGVMGMRPLDRYPSLFIDAVQQQSVGSIVGPIRSGAGFHLLKVIERNAADTQLTVTQTLARHILLRPGGQMSVNAARAELDRFKRSIEAGQADFAELARQHSQDGSASKGGDLGWSSPGMFVPEFEETMNRLAPKQISDPLVSRFGVHLIQVLERRKTPMSVREQKEMARNALRESKFEETYQTWSQEVRGRAYVEYRDPPQ